MTQFFFLCVFRVFFSANVSFFRFWSAAKKCCDRNCDKVTSAGICATYTNPSQTFLIIVFVVILVQSPAKLRFLP